MFVHYCHHVRQKENDKYMGGHRTIISDKFQGHCQIEKQNISIYIVYKASLCSFKHRCCGINSITNTAACIV